MHAAKHGVELTESDGSETESQSGDPHLSSAALHVPASRACEEGEIAIVKSNFCRAGREVVGQGIAGLVNHVSATTVDKILVAFWSRFLDPADKSSSA